MSQPLVYVADDEPEMVELLTEVLQDAGYDVRSSDNGSALLDRVAEQRPDLILLDINMPGLTGWEVRQRLQKEADEVPVIAVTAQGGQSIETSALNTLGFTGFVRKPFKLGDLLGQVEDALSKKHV